MSERLTILRGDALEQLKTLPEDSVQCCVTSPPYWGLRDYGVAGQMGLERTPEEYVGKMVEVFREVRRVLKADGTAWVNLGDCYVARAGSQVSQTKQHIGSGFCGPNRAGMTGLKPKDLIGIAWRVAFALQADGWWLRCDIVWHKPNPMPESVTDRPTRAHEYIFLLSKAARYYYDAEAIKEAATDTGRVNGRSGRDEEKGARPPGSRPRTLARLDYTTLGRNKRSVWSVATDPYPEAHFATYPEELIRPCILAGSRAGDVVLDPFAGSGTTGKVALELGRRAVLIELNPEYVKLIEQRCAVTPGLALG